MPSFSKEYLKETLIQAKKHGLSPRYIKDLEEKYKQETHQTK